MNNTAALSSREVFRAGTLTYTRNGLIVLFLWMLWGDFCYTLMETLTPTLVPLLLRRHQATNFLIGLLVGSIPQVMNVIINPIVSTASDSLRTRWGRRRPFLLFGTPFVCLFLILLGWSESIGRWAHQMLQSDLIPKEVFIGGLIAVLVVAFQLFNLFIATIFYYIFADVVPKIFIGRFMALFRVVGTAAGLAWNLFILPHAANHIPLIFTSVSLLYLVSFSCMCIKVKEGEYPPVERHEEDRVLNKIIRYFKECFSSPFFDMLFLCLALNTASTACRTLFNLLYAMEKLKISFEQYGQVGAVCAIIGMGLFLPVGYLVDKFHPLRVYMGGAVLVIFTNIWAFYWCRDYNSFFIVSISLTVVYVLQNASTLPLAISLYPNMKYGQFCSAAAMFNAGIMVLANAGGGLFIDYFGYQHIFMWDFFFTCMGLLVLVWVYCKWKALGGDKLYSAADAMNSTWSKKHNTK